MDLQEKQQSFTQAQRACEQSCPGKARGGGCWSCTFRAARLLQGLRHTPNAQPARGVALDQQLAGKLPVATEEPSHWRTNQELGKEKSQLTTSEYMQTMYCPQNVLSPHKPLHLFKAGQKLPTLCFIFLEAEIRNTAIQIRRNCA